MESIFSHECVISLQAGQEEEERKNKTQSKTWLAVYMYKCVYVHSTHKHGCIY